MTPSDIHLETWLWILEGGLEGGATRNKIEQYCTITHKQHEIRALSLWSQSIYNLAPFCDGQWWTNMVFTFKFQNVWIKYRLRHKYRHRHRYLDMYVDTHIDKQIDTSISFFSVFICLFKAMFHSRFNVDNILLNIDKGTFLIHSVRWTRISDKNHLNNTI